jgi:hypothetical protein
MRRRFFPFALLLGFLAVEAPLVDALAQPVQPAPSSTASASPAPAQDEADRLFREGNELYKQKRFADAEALFEKAFAKKPAHDIAANLGYVELYQNKLVEAAEHLSYAVRIWPPTGKDDKRQGAIERLAKVKAEIATLTIEVNVAGAHVTIGEREVGTSPLAGEVFADAGRVVVRVKREGYVDAERAIDVAKGSAQTVSVVLEAVPASAPTATASRRRQRARDATASASAEEHGAGVRDRRGGRGQLDRRRRAARLGRKRTHTVARRRTARKRRLAAVLENARGGKRDQGRVRRMASEGSDDQHGRERRRRDVRGLGPRAGRGGSLLVLAGENGGHDGAKQKLDVGSARRRRQRWCDLHGKLLGDCRETQTPLARELVPEWAERRSRLLRCHIRSDHLSPGCRG